MTANYKRIGDYISLVDERNTNGSITSLMGISVDKCYIKSVANVIGTDLKNYKVIRKGLFSCSLMQVSRDQKIPIALYSYDSPAIMSPAYVLFEVNRLNELLPEYLSQVRAVDKILGAKVTKRQVLSVVILDLMLDFLDKASGCRILTKLLQVFRIFVGELLELYPYILSRTEYIISYI